MATFHCSAVVIALLCLACSPGESTEVAAPVAAIATQRIEHVVPKRDFVGPSPSRFEWTPVEGVESYTIVVTTEIDIVVFRQAGVRGAAIDWARDVTLDAGTYVWRVVGIKDGRTIADSGRAAFVVTGS